jgi:hypothetical protein
MSMGILVTVECSECSHSAEFELTEKQSLQKPSELKFRCKCGGKGHLVSFILPDDRACSLAVKCVRCGEELLKERVAAMPGTRLCVECASSDPSQDRRRFIEEPWGSPEAYKRDRGSWRR